jgi:hypothetical protein
MADYHPTDASQRGTSKGPTSRPFVSATRQFL